MTALSRIALMAAIIALFFASRRRHLSTRLFVFIVTSRKEDDGREARR